MRGLDVARVVIVAVLLAFAGIAIVGALAQTGRIAAPTPSPTPSPTRDPGAFWRIEGVAIDDETTLPIAGVCVVIGPGPCQPTQPRTDAGGRFFFDVPKGITVAYDLHFQKEGYAQVDYHLTVIADLNFPVRMQRIR